MLRLFFMGTLKKFHTRKKMSTFTRGRSARQGYSGNSSREKSSGERGRTPSRLTVFFAQYEDFTYNPENSATDEFYRLCDSYGWDNEDAEKQDAKNGFQDALTMQFNNMYGTDENDITNWQALCARLRMDPIPESLDTCRQAVKNTHVNLVDLVDSFGTQKEAQIFPTEVALSVYTKSTGKYFPKDNAYAGNLLKFLLRQIFNPGSSEFGRASGGRGRRRRRRGRGA